MKVFLLEDDEARIALVEQAARGHELTVARSFRQATKQYRPPYDLLLLDHDLGGRQFVDSADEETGYRFVQWLGPATPETCAPVVVHSYNPGGARNMSALLSDNGWRAQWCPFGREVLALLTDHAAEVETR